MGGLPWAVPRGFPGGLLGGPMTNIPWKPDQKSRDSFHWPWGALEGSLGVSLGGFFGGQMMTKIFWVPG